jgi:DNA-binding transcriptional LysR family regulator
MLMLDTHRLKIFLKIADLKSFSKAAETMYLTQPTVSQHMSSLEKYLGLKLFDRMGRKVILTRAGEILYRYAKQITSLSDEALQSLELLKGNQMGHIMLGASTIPGEYILPSLIGRFKILFPDITITLRIGDTEETVNDILNNNIELGMIGAKIKNPKLKLSYFMEEEMVLVVPNGHRWRNKTSIDVKELFDEPFIMRERGSGTRLSMEKKLHTMGIMPEEFNITAEVGSSNAVKQAVKANIGISIISELAVKEEIKLQLLKKIDIKNIQFIRTFFIVQNKNKTPSPLCKAFLHFLFKQK